MEAKMLQFAEGRRPVAKAVEAVRAMRAEGVREATTGQIVTVIPQVWAVAGGAAEAAMPAKSPVPVERTRERVATPPVELAFYRKYSEALLRRYVQMTMEAGRVSSLMGREVLGGKASSYRVHGFDDAVIFRLDVEKCLSELHGPEMEVLRRVAMQEYTQGEAAVLLGISLRTCVTRYSRALDRLTEILLRRRLLEPMRGCQ